MKTISKFPLQALDGLAGVASHDLEFVGLEAFRLDLEPGDGGALLFQRDDMPGSARQGLESQHTATGKTIEHLGACAFRRKPVEQGFTDAIRGWAQSRGIADRDFAAAPFTANNPDLRFHDSLVFVLYAGLKCTDGIAFC